MGWEKSMGSRTAGAEQEKQISDNKLSGYGCGASVACAHRAPIVPGPLDVVMFALCSTW